MNTFDTLNAQWTIERGDVVRVTENFLRMQETYTVDTAISQDLDVAVALRNMGLLIMGGSLRPESPEEAMEQMNKIPQSPDEKVKAYLDHFRSMLNKHKAMTNQYNLDYRVSRWLEITSGGPVRKSFVVQAILQDATVPAAEQLVAVLMSDDDRVTVPVLHLEKVGSALTQAQIEERRMIKELEGMERSLQIRTAQALADVARSAQIAPTQSSKKQAGLRAFVARLLGRIPNGD